MLIQVLPQLKMKNYVNWEQQLYWYLKIKLGFIDGSICKPNETSLDLIIWEQVNSVFYYWMFNSCDAFVKATISCSNNAKTMLGL